MDAAGPTDGVHGDRVVSDRNVEHGPEDDLGLALPVHALIAQLRQEPVQPTGRRLAKLQPTHAGQHEVVQHPPVLVGGGPLDASFSLETGDPQSGEVDQACLGRDELTGRGGASAQGVSKCPLRGRLRGACGSDATSVAVGVAEPGQGSIAPVADLLGSDGPPRPKGGGGRAMALLAL